MSDDRQAAASKSKRPLSAVPDGRDAIIERLERTVADEQQKSAELRKANDELRFKLEILEKSYAKQLEDARRENAEQRAQMIGFREDTMRLIDETRGVLERVTSERDRLREQLERAGVTPAEPGSRPGGEPSPPEGTINELIANPAWARERKPAGEPHLQAHAGTADESPSEEMIAPELVFTKDGDDDEDEDERRA
jgi:hypothetical protein